MSRLQAPSNEEMLRCMRSLSWYCSRSSPTGQSLKAPDLRIFVFTCSCEIISTYYSGLWEHQVTPTNINHITSIATRLPHAETVYAKHPSLLAQRYQAWVWFLQLLPAGIVLWLPWGLVYRITLISWGIHIWKPDLTSTCTHLTPPASDSFFLHEIWQLRLSCLLTLMLQLAQASSRSQALCTHLLEPHTLVG